MAKKLSDWCKKVKCAMIMQDMTVSELADMLGRSREYISAVVNGRAYSDNVTKEISDLLNIEDTACSLPMKKSISQ